MRDDNLKLNSAKLRLTVAAIFTALGLAAEESEIVADGLVQADEEGISSHGIMLLPMYIDRIRSGSVSLNTKCSIIRDQNATAVLDAGNSLGQISARQALTMTIGKAKEYGLGCVTVRNGFHFGTAGYHALKFADAGCIGIVMCNTRPLLPAPGGAEPLVGNNPIAIAVPNLEGGQPVVLDMALSATAMGKIRLAEAAGEEIPLGWASDSNGVQTTSPTKAIEGMLLPAAGPKGFGLAFMIELLCGGLSSGAIGADVKPLYGDASEPYACAHFFLGLDTAHFRDLDEFKSVVAGMVQRVSTSKAAPGVERTMSPGEPAWRAKSAQHGFCRVSASVHQDLLTILNDLGMSREAELNSVTA